jgi:hypothetical protein
MSWIWIYVLDSQHGSWILSMDMDMDMDSQHGSIKPYE